MRVRLRVVLAARAAKEEQNRLGVFGPHPVSLRRWPVVVKRSTLPYQRRGY
jgi:hypothetical protein